MNWLPIGTILGDLVMEDTLVFYDGPRLFTCRSLTDQLYLAAWAEEGEEADLWLYVAVSQNRYDMARSGGIELRRTFQEPEGGLLYTVAIPYHDGEADSATPTQGSSLPDEWLPAEGFTLDLPTETLPPAESLDDIERVARQESRSRLRLEVLLPEYTRSEAPTRRIGELLVSTQLLFDNIGLVLLENDPPQRGRVPARVTSETASEVVGIAAASFVVEIAANRLDDLLGDSTFAQATKKLFALLQVGPERDPLLDELATLRPRGAKSFRSFVRTLQSSGGDVTIAAAGNSIGSVTEKLTADRLDAFVTVLNALVPDETAELRGRMRLYLVDVARGRFGLEDESDGTVYEGKIADRAVGQADHATVNNRYDVVISEYAMFDEAVGERKPRYILEQLVSIEDGVNEPVVTQRTIPSEE